ncbi:MAG: hypothetical protein ACK4L4_11360 [Gemmobacter sp.]
MTAHLAEISVAGVPSDQAMVMRTVVVLVMAGLPVGGDTGGSATGRDPAGDMGLSGAVGADHGGIPAVLFPGDEAERGIALEPKDKPGVVIMAVFAALSPGERLATVNWMGVALVAADALLVAL